MTGGQNNLVSELGLIENLINFENSPDFGSTLGSLGGSDRGRTTSYGNEENIDGGLEG